MYYMNHIDYLIKTKKYSRDNFYIKDACLKLGISIDKYYRYKKSLD